MIKLRFPVDYIYVSSPFGPRTINGKKSTHYGTDLGWSSKHGGQNVNLYAAADGVVKAVVDGRDNDLSSSTYGNYVLIDHGNGVETLYGHMLKGTPIKKGTKVKRGDVIGKMNNSGYSFGSHAHFEVRINGEKVDPLKYTYADVSMIINSTTAKTYTIMTYDFSKPEPTPEPEPTPTPEPVTELKVGDKVKIIGAYAESSKSTRARHTRMVGYVRTIVGIYPKTNFPYQIGTFRDKGEPHTIGFAKESTIKKT